MQDIATVTGIPCFHTSYESNLPNMSGIRISDAPGTGMFQLDNVQLHAHFGRFPLFNDMLRPHGPLGLRLDTLLSNFYYEKRSNANYYAYFLIRWTMKHLSHRYRNIYLNGYRVATQWAVCKKTDVFARYIYQNILFDQYGNLAMPPIYRLTYKVTAKRVWITLNEGIVNPTSATIFDLAYHQSIIDNLVYN